MPGIVTKMVHAPFFHPLDAVRCNGCPKLTFHDTLTPLLQPPFKLSLRSGGERRSSASVGSKDSTVIRAVLRDFRLWEAWGTRGTENVDGSPRMLDFGTIRRAKSTFYKIWILETLNLYRFERGLFLSWIFLLE